MTVAEFIKLNEQIELLRQQRDRSQGALDEIKKTMQEKFGCDEKDAPVLLASKKADQAIDMEAYQAQEAEFVQRWGHLLEKK